MTSSLSLQQLLEEMASLLASHGDGSWRAAFQRLAVQAANQPEEVLHQIRGSFAGMGSLSDIVLHGSDGKPLSNENDRFDSLRQELYQRVHR